jgi:hypothetical protein
VVRLQGRRDVRSVELRYHGEYGDEAQILRNRELALDGGLCSKSRP